MTKIDETRIVPFECNKDWIDYGAGWRYWFISNGVVVKARTRKAILDKLRWYTTQEQSAGEMKVDAADDGFKTRGICHAE